jgi:hypothetical protein
MDAQSQNERSERIFASFWGTYRHFTVIIVTCRYRDCWHDLACDTAVWFRRSPGRFQLLSVLYFTSSDWHEQTYSSSFNFFFGYLRIQHLQRFHSLQCCVFGIRVIKQDILLAMMTVQFYENGKYLSNCHAFQNLPCDKRIQKGGWGPSFRHS